jgi:very-short-patch-repair endonuclease
LYWYEFGKNFWAIAQKHIDFIITDYNWKILALIELDGFSHNYDKTKNNDIFKNELFQNLNIPLVRFNVNSFYNFSILENYLI